VYLSHVSIFVPNWKHTVYRIYSHLYSKKGKPLFQILYTVFLVLALTLKNVPLSAIRRRLCGWHKLNRNLTRKSQFVGLLAKLREDSDADPSAEIEWEMMVQWLWSFTRDYESEEEATMSMELLKHYLDGIGGDKIGEDLKDALETFITKSFHPLRNKLYSSVFHQCRCFDERVSSVGESENATMKKAATGPRANHRIDQSLSAIDSLAEQRNRTKAMKSASMFHSVPTDANTRETNVHEVTQYCSSKMAQEADQKDNYLSFKKDDETFAVKLDEPDEECWPEGLSELERLKVNKIVPFIRYTVFLFMRGLMIPDVWYIFSLMG
jgi:hypothetical protein